MGLAMAEVRLRNPRRPELGAVRIEALADTGSVHLCIPAALCEALALEAIDTRPVTLADGSARRVPYVGPIETRCLHRVGFTGALVMGDQPLLGAIPMEDMDLVVVPKDRRGGGQSCQLRWAGFHRQGRRCCDDVAVVAAAGSARQVVVEAACLRARMPAPPGVDPLTTKPPPIPVPCSV